MGTRRSDDARHGLFLLTRGILTFYLFRFLILPLSLDVNHATVMPMLCPLCKNYSEMFLDFVRFIKTWADPFFVFLMSS